MKKLLALKGIKTIFYEDQDKGRHLFEYTDKMFANRAFIELYEQENIKDPESDKGFKTSIDVFVIMESKSYEITILFDTRPYVPPIYLYRAILDTIEIIENCERLSIIDYLKEVAMASISSDDYTTGHWQNNFNNRVKERIQGVLKLIQQNGIAGEHKNTVRRINSR